MIINISRVPAVDVGQKCESGSGNIIAAAHPHGDVGKAEEAGNEHRRPLQLHDPRQHDRRLDVLTATGTKIVDRDSGSREARPHRGIA